MVTTHGGRRFDRRPAPDSRDQRFLVADAFKGMPLRGRGWQAGPLLDQGPTGSCVGNGWAGEAGATPVRVPGITEAVAVELYDAMQLVDEFADTPPAEGTSVRAGAKVMVERGYITEYRWARNAREVALAIGWEGPVVIGVDWHEGMMEPDASGTVRAAGRAVGGHCVYLRSYSLARRRFKLRNSWGDWGPLHGDAWLPESDLDWLLGAGGEACVPMGRRLPT